MKNILSVTVMLVSCASICCAVVANLRRSMLMRYLSTILSGINLGLLAWLVSLLLA